MSKSGTEEKELKPSEREAIRGFVLKLFILPALLISVLSAAGGYIVSEKIQTTVSAAEQSGSERGEAKAKQEADAELAFLRALLEDNVTRSSNAVAQATTASAQLEIMSDRLADDQEKAAKIRRELEEQEKEVARIAGDLSERIKEQLPTLARILASDESAPFVRFRTDVKDQVFDQVSENTAQLSNLKQERVNLNERLDQEKSRIDQLTETLEGLEHCAIAWVHQSDFENGPIQMLRGLVSLDLEDITDNNTLEGVRLNDASPVSLDRGSGFESANGIFSITVLQVDAGRGQDDEALISVCKKLNLERGGPEEE